jgi:hypothetical protein
MRARKSETIEILRGSKGYIDLAFPTKMTERQRADFVSLMRKIYDPRVVKEYTTEEFTRDWRIGDMVLYPRRWEAEEYLILLESKSPEIAMPRIGRSWYSCELKDADWRFKLVSFCDKNGVSLSGKDKLDVVRKFLKAQEIFTQQKRRVRSADMSIKNLGENLKDLRKEEAQQKSIYDSLAAKKYISDSVAEKEYDKLLKTRRLIADVEARLKNEAREKEKMLKEIKDNEKFFA